MKLLRQRDIPEEKYSNAFLGFGPEETNFVVELTYSMFKYLIFIQIPTSKFPSPFIFFKGKGGLVTVLGFSLTLEALY